jgi:hypothetical protein
MPPFQGPVIDITVELWKLMTFKYEPQTALFKDSVRTAQ